MSDLTEVGTELRAARRRAEAAEAAAIAGVDALAGAERRHARAEEEAGHAARERDAAAAASAAALAEAERCALQPCYTHWRWRVVVCDRRH